MKVSFKDFGPHVPDKDRYECGIDYLHHDFDLELDDAFYLVSHLKHNHSSVAIYAGPTVLDFSIDRDGLNVQIEGDSTWVASDLALDVAKEILKAAYDGCEDFGTTIPGTTIEWDAYFG
jgi:hypothetical protein